MSTAATMAPPGIRAEGLREMKRGAMAVFSMGDYAKIAERLDGASRRLISACEIAPGHQVLDVAAGNGNAAVWAAKSGAGVIASDLTAAMVQMGRSRTSAAGLHVDWVRADAETLPFPDATFDCVTSVFGASMAPRPELAAAELFRVARPGGKVAMANWTPEGLAGRLGDLLGGYLGNLPTRPRCEKGSPAMRWGTQTAVEDLLGTWAESITFRKLLLRSKFKCFESYLHLQEANFGVLIAAKRKLSPDRYDQMIGEIREMTLTANSSPNGALWIDSEYLQIVAVKTTG